MCLKFALCVQSKFCVFGGFWCVLSGCCVVFICFCVFFVGLDAYNKQILQSACYVQCVPCLLFSAYVVY